MIDSVDKVDLVVTWVDGDDPDFYKKVRQYSSNPTELNPERFRDMYQMLKYNLRSVHQFMPWVNHIYIVTQRPQIPKWLNRESSRVTVIHHDEIYQDAQYLPTFSFFSIFSQLYRIPNLSPYFITMSDDEFIGRPLLKTDFIAPNGTINVYGMLFGKWLNFKSCIPVKRRLFDFLEHMPRVSHQPLWQQFEEKYSDYLHQVRSHRFRSKSFLQPDYTFKNFLLRQTDVSTRCVSIFEHLRNVRFVKVVNNEKKVRRKLSKLVKTQPRFFCLNDDQRDDPNLKVCADVRAFLESYFPNSAPWEV